MRPLSRRSALLLGGLGLAGTVTGGTGLALTLASQRSVPTAGADLQYPSVLQSSDGSLNVQLEAGGTSLLLAGRQASALAYNKEIPGPTLRIRPGDVLKIRLINNLSEPTNLHMHGLHVSPQGNGDNPFIRVDPGTAVDYEYRLPRDHPPGVYWYHPHHHGGVADQVFAGLYGAIIVEDPEATNAGLERILLVSDTTLDPLGNIHPASPMERMLGREGELLLVNGQLNPQLTAPPGDTERWRVINACASRHLRLRLDGQHVRLIGTDSGRLPLPVDTDELFLAPGNRADILVETVTGESVLLAAPYDRGSVRGMAGPGGSAGVPPAAATPLALLRVSGARKTSGTAVPAASEALDLRLSGVAAHRQLTFGTQMGMGMMGFTLNGKRFDPTRTDITASADTVEEWTLLNDSPMEHPFHLHIWPMQVTEVNDRMVKGVRLQDVVNVPANGRVKVRVSFADFTGRSVYHCHILDHEDLGMMGVIEVR
ncbi:multicopper oxidase family protein [Arthrobacter sp. NtRootA1]|uniref:multicopper oxidase family protein n=1 Tax=Arthrobacter sp. NtRootA1 TaxID=2830983 RepID=UPI001CC3BED4|nr:multicopper oxidase family protein [Arthrobacter sp. NtRootA1]BCW06141.1 hypothetical protein NtRootA1_22790 [Arthrobacter sp. NtRootA1]